MIEPKASKRVLLAGGSGLLGGLLIPVLIKNGYDPIVLSRSDQAIIHGVRSVQWLKQSEEWRMLLTEDHHIISLCGSRVSKRLGESEREEALSSRLHSMAVLKQAIREANGNTLSWITIGSFRSDADSQYKDLGFLDQLADKWEQRFIEAEGVCERMYFLRAGIVMGDDGFLAGMERMAKLGLGGRWGSSEPIWSWTHLKDLNEICLDLLAKPRPSGPINAFRDRPIGQRRLFDQICEKHSISVRMSLPMVFIRSMAILKGFNHELLCQGRQASTEHGSGILNDDDTIY